MISDFTWTGFGSDAAITEHVVDALRGLGGFEPGPVEMIQDPKLKRPRGSRRGRPRVWLPYQGPPLYDLWITGHAQLDLEKSSVWLVKQCRTCGEQQYAADGIERWETSWDTERREAVKTHIRRSSGRGFYLAENAIAGTGVFHTREFPAWPLCTDLVKECVEREGFTNVSFLEAGETF